ncbi:AAA family ATPase [Enterococcus faecium]|uniref:AAA family ATPase n=1 Tax=Enterococcus faecium TaxID=1352 RepID=UPI003C6BF51F
MKPKKLQLKNFGPFINETVDFSRLTEAPLFLISGKTGAGKTTIFDGITFALLVKLPEDFALEKRCVLCLLHQTKKQA